MKQTTNHILVPLDFSKQSIIALEQSYNLARLSGSEIVLLHVVRENNAVFGLFSEKEQKDMMLRLKNKLDDFARKAMEQSQLEINTILTRGKVVDQIIETAEHLDAQFIIMGTHRPENIMKRIIGSTALRVIKEAKCPVISIEGIHQYCFTYGFEKRNNSKTRRNN
jgi:nucleotide-binding universal stress UspA family protein